MADLDKTFLTIEHEASMTSTCTEDMDQLPESSEESMRVPGGDCECNPVYPRNPLVVRSTEHVPPNECHPTCPYASSNQNQQSSVQRQPGYDTCPAQQRGSQSQGEDCGCGSRRARRTASSHYMDYKEFLHSPKPNPVYVPTDYSNYPPEPEQNSQSACGCAATAPARMQSVEQSYSPQESRQGSQAQDGCCCRNSSNRQSMDTGYPSPENRRKRSSENSSGSRSPERKQPVGRYSDDSCGCKTPPRRQSVERNYAPQRRQSTCSCRSRTSTRGRSTQRRSCSRSRPINPPDKSFYLRKPTPAAQTCAVRQHAHSHVQGCYKPPPPPPKRSCPPPAIRKSRPRNRSACASKGRKSGRCSTCCEDEYNQVSETPSDYVENCRAGIQCLRNPVAQTHSNPNNNNQLSHQSSRPGRRRSTCSGCRKQQSDYGSRCSRKPPLCSNETLVEKPVQSYRFCCPENRKSPCRTVKICPKCHKLRMQKQRSVSIAKRCASEAARKCCSQLRYQPIMPHIASQRCIYKTCGRPSSFFKTKYELTLCCKKRRCQGGKNGVLAGTIATDLKKRCKFVSPGAHSVSPNDTYRTTVLSSQQSRLRSPSAHQRRQTPATPPVQKRNHSGNLASMPVRSPSSAPKPTSYSASRTPPSLPTPSAAPTYAALQRRHERSSRSPDAETPRSSHRHPKPSQHREEEQEPQEPQESQGRREPHQPSNTVVPRPLAPHGPPQIAPDYMAPQPPVPHGPPQIAPVYMAPPSPSRRHQLQEYQQQRATSFLGTEINPFYRGSFLSPRTPMVPQAQHPLPPIDPHPQHLPAMVPHSPALPPPFDPHTQPLPHIEPSLQKSLPLQKMSQGESTVMKSRWSGLGVLQAWVFGDSFVANPVVGRKSSRGTWSWRQIFGRSKKRNKPSSQGANE